MTNAIGNAMAERRAKLKLSQREMSARIDVAPQHISDWENGRNVPSEDTLRKISKGYRLKVGVLQELRRLSAPNLTFDLKGSSDLLRDTLMLLHENYADLKPSQLRRIKRAVNGSSK